MEPTTSSNTNVLPALKTPSILYALLAFIVLLIVVLICFMNNVPNPFKGRPSKSTQEAVDPGGSAQLSQCNVLRAQASSETSPRILRREHGDRNREYVHWTEVQI